MCFFVCVCLSVYVCHDVCPDDLAMKDWCHTNNILQVYSWGRLVVQVMLHALVTSSMTSPGHRVGQILKLIYLSQYFNYRVDQKLEISEMLMAFWSVYYFRKESLSRPPNGGHFENVEILNTASFLPQICKFSDFCSRYIIGVAGDDIMYILVCQFHCWSGSS